MRVLKYPLEVNVTGEQEVLISGHAEPLSVASQWQEDGEHLMLWCSVHEASRYKTVLRVWCVMTGQEREDIAKRAEFIGTALMDGGGFVVHVYVEVLRQ